MVGHYQRIIRAYPETYLNKVISVIGDAFDYAVNDCGIAGSEFAKIFAASTLCKRIENGEVIAIVGKSGIEVVVDSLFEVTGKVLNIDPCDVYERTAAYWCGYAICYYQWGSSRKYSDIFRTVSFDEIMNLYSTLHEASLEKFAEVIDNKIRCAYPHTNLKRIRTTYGCSQRELAEMSGVSLRLIQMYEQRNKDINKAQAGSVYRLAKVLGCAMVDLLEC